MFQIYYRYLQLKYKINKVLPTRDVNLGVFLLSRDNQILKYTVSR